jgi:hemoglobin
MSLYSFIKQRYDHVNSIFIESLMSEIETPYDRIGGEPAVRKLCQTFYQVMRDTPQTQLIRAMHPEQIGLSEEKLYLFLTGWLGGPPIYTDKYGHPRLRKRHMLFPIGIEERDQWLYCMAQALKTMGLDELFSQQLMGSFVQTADFMRNKPNEE